MESYLKVKEKCQRKLDINEETEGRTEPQCQCSFRRISFASNLQLEAAAEFKHGAVGLF